MARLRLNLPNTITIARIISCPVLFLMVLSPNPGWLFGAFALFVAAAVSDLWDGYLARKHGLVTDLGKLLDPMADKLLLITTFIPFYLVSHRPDPITDVPLWGPLPLWVVLVIFGREVGITIFRSWAARKGQVLSAGPSGKVKALSQNIFSGGLILWYALARTAENEGWGGNPLWEGWAIFHGAVVGVMLGVAIFLTIYSLVVYLREYRAAQRRGSGTPGVE